MPEPQILDQRCSIVASTPDDAQHFFGFHDVTPWDEGDSRLALLQVPKSLRATPSASDTAHVCLWDPASEARELLASTNAFNWQQGARLQWYGANQLLFNDLEDGSPVSRIFDVGKKANIKSLPAVYSLDPQREFGLAPDWWRLARWWRDYSYDLPADSQPTCGEPGDLRAVDLATGKEKVIVPISVIREKCAQGLNASRSDFISHATFSPKGSRFCFMYRRFSEDGALFSFFLTANRDGSDIQLLAREKCSHFDWIDENQLILWTRKLPSKAAALRAGGLTRKFPFKQMVQIVRRLNPKLKQSLFAENYYRIDARNPGLMEAIGNGVLEQDGHPMFTPDRRWLITDTYSYEGNQPLILFHIETQTRQDLIAFPVHANFSEPSLKCDLHPRLDRAGKRVAVDSGHTGERQLYFVDIHNALTEET